MGRRVLMIPIHSWDPLAQFFKLRMDIASVYARAYANMDRFAIYCNARACASVLIRCTFSVSALKNVL